MNIINRTLSCLFPNICGFCDEIMPHSKTGVYICDECMERVRFCVKEHCCEICGSPMQDADHKICESCFANISAGAPVYYKAITAVCVYDDKSSRGILRFKAGGCLGTAETYAGLINAMVSENFKNVKFDLAAAVPPRHERMRSPGFDQCHLLAYKTAKLMGITYKKNMLKRVRRVQKQTSLGRSDRQQNLNGAFALRIPSDYISGRTILVIDDVTTTGATMNECARVLKGSGAKAVYGAAIAVTAEPE